MSEVIEAKDVEVKEIKELNSEKETKSKLINILTAVVAIIAGVVIITYQPAFLMIVAATAIAYGALQVIKYLKTKSSLTNSPLLTIGIFLILAGIMMLISRSVAESGFIFIEMGLGVFTGTGAIIWIVNTLKEKNSINKVMFWFKLIFALIVICLSIILIVFAFTGKNAVQMQDGILTGVLMIAFGVTTMLNM